MELHRSEEPLGAGPRVGMGDKELLRAPDAIETHEVAAKVQAALAPDADREDRDVDLVELPEGRSPAMPLVVQRMRPHLWQESVAVTAVDVVAHRLVVQQENVAHPHAREHARRDPTLVHPVAVHVARPVVGDDRPQVGRAGARRVPLAPAEVRLADHADLARRPVLRGDPLDHVVEGLALAAGDGVPRTLRPPAAGDVDPHVGVAPLQVEADRTGLDEREGPLRRQVAQRLLVGRGAHQRREGAPDAGRQVDVGAYDQVVSGGDLHLERLHHRLDHVRCSFPSPWVPEIP